MHEYQQALADYTKAIELDPGCAIAYYNRGLTHQHVKDYHRAIADFTRVIEGRN
ncbi:MAG: tetratricopeptide repeat protein [Ktedonobacteraceae bacterium]|nr:tetratricopeptide repeat protein [Ktedonobacteraceae bacterium]MBO0792710.1 tetratricopeptide repeat protein [Ktedonobacteraceae bacterium]